MAKVYLYLHSLTYTYTFDLTFALCRLLFDLTAVGLLT